MLKAIGALFVAMVLLPFAAGAEKAPEDWNHNHYFEFSELSLATVGPEPSSTYPECTWQGAKYVSNFSPPDFLPFNCVNSAYLWAPVCKEGEQTVEFKKRIWLPGDASEFQASLVSVKDGTLLSMEILVNGQRALRATTSVHKENLGAARTAFNPGWNSIVVRATKKKSGPCNNFSADVGVYAHLHAKFAADLVMKTPTCCTTGKGVFAGELTIENRGPSTAPNVALTYYAYTQNLFLIKDEPNRAFIVRRDNGAGELLTGCSYLPVGPLHRNSTDYYGYSVTCDVGELKPGEKAVVVVIYRYNIPKTGDFFAAWPIRWDASSTEIDDPKSGNDTGIKMQYACRPAKPPLCKDGAE